MYAGYLHDIDVRLEDALVGRLEAAWTTTSRNLNIVATSVYDHSLQDQFSKVLQRLIGSLPHLEQLLNSFVAVCIFYVIQREDPLTNV